MYDFNKVINRRGTYSYKWDRLDREFGNPDLLPLWVADMDWETPPFIREALRKVIDELPVFGYTADPDEWWPTVIQWIKDHHQWEVKREWITYVPGIVKGIGMAVNALLKDDEKVIVQPPVYHPFFLTPQHNHREVVWNPLIEVNDDEGHLMTYRMDFDNLAEVCDDKCRMLILANPHNPCGITWDRATLQQLAHFAKEHNLIVISDEIHCDLAIYGHKHIPFATVSDEAAEVSITFSAPTKTFNMAGIVSSWVIISNDTLRERYFSWLEASELNEATMFAPFATIAALKEGEPWRQELLKYLEGNIDYIIDFCHQHIPQIHAVRPDASYLVWLDCRGLRLSHDALIDLFQNKAGLALNSGTMFGKQGDGFMRLNAGCPRATLQLAMEKLRDAIDER